MNSVLSARDVKKSFREGKESVDVLSGVDLAVERGEIVSLEGPSGSGKTTFLSILGCILTPTSGHIEVDGRMVDSASEDELAEVRKKSIGFVFQQFNLFAALSARENVEYALNIKGVRGRDARAQAAEMLSLVGLEERMDFRPRDLSGGQKQRIAIARALVARPAVLLADEPTANLDSHVGAQILDLFQDVAHKQGCGVLIVTHDARVRRICDRALEIRDGRIAA